MSCIYNEDCIGTCISGVCSAPSQLGNSCDAEDSDDCAGSTVHCNNQDICGGFGAVW